MGSFFGTLKRVFFKRSEAIAVTDRYRVADSEGLIRAAHATF